MGDLGLSARLAREAGKWGRQDLQRTGLASPRWQAGLARWVRRVSASTAKRGFQDRVSRAGQQLFAAAMDANGLPANFASAANALEGLAFSAMDALLVVDDFTPNGRIARSACRELRATAVPRRGKRSGEQPTELDRVLGLACRSESSRTRPVDAAGDAAESYPYRGDGHVSDQAPRFVQGCRDGSRDHPGEPRCGSSPDQYCARASPSGRLGSHLDPRARPRRHRGRQRNGSGSIRWRRGP